MTLWGQFFALVLNSIEIEKFIKVLDAEAVLAVIVAVAISGRIVFDCKLPKKI